ncbi:hypothetical protein [Ruoffia halotolerans]|nr:hypothetical protein [Ruoffia halotolerans]
MKRWQEVSEYAKETGMQFTEINAPSNRQVMSRKTAFEKKLTLDLC